MQIHLPEGTAQSVLDPITKGSVVLVCQRNPQIRRKSGSCCKKYGQKLSEDFEVYPAGGGVLSPPISLTYPTKFSCDMWPLVLRGACGRRVQFSNSRHGVQQVFDNFALSAEVEVRGNGTRSRYSWLSDSSEPIAPSDGYEEPIAHERGNIILGQLVTLGINSGSGRRWR